MEDAVKDELGDKTLCVEGKDIEVSRALLSCASPVFRAMFGPNFKENDQERIAKACSKYNALLYVHENMIVHISFLDENKYAMEICSIKIKHGI